MLDIKQMIENKETTTKSKGIWCQLHWNDPIEIEDVHEERIKGKLKINMKEFFIYSHSINRTKGYSILCKHTHERYLENCTCHVT